MIDEKNAWVALGYYVDDRGNEIPVGVPVRDFRLHTMISGSTGSGKSTFARNLALQFMALGVSVVLIEPHGDLVTDPKEGILAALTPDEIKRTVVLDLASSWPPQINLATTGLSVDNDTAVEMAMRCISVVEKAGFEQAVAMREKLEHAFAVILSAYGWDACMVHMHRFVTDGLFRQSVLKRVGEDAGEAKMFWQRWLDKQEKKKGNSTADDELEVVQRRTGKFVRNGILRRSLSLTPILPGRDLRINSLLNTDESTLLLVPLQASKLGANVKRVFGTLVMQQIANMFMRRSDQLAEDRRTTIILIDEVRNIAAGEVTEIVKILLAEARKFGAGVILLFQFLNQLPQDLREELEMNANNKIALRLGGRKDAKIFASAFGTTKPTETDAMKIEKYHGYAQVMIHGDKQRPFYFQTLSQLSLKSNGHTRPSAELNLANISIPPALDELRNLAKQQPSRAIEALAQLKDREFRGLAEAQTELGYRIADALLSDPGLMPDPVERALQISRARFGMPWWFYEAQYRRLRF